MATIKSFTDLSQSKILSKILPLDSADMFWLVLGNTPRVHVLTEPLSNYSNWENYPCWSIAALLSVLPRIDIEKEICSDDTFDYRVKAYIGDGYLGDWFDNPVDACYDMILKLKESNLL